MQVFFPSLWAGTKEYLLTSYFWTFSRESKVALSWGQDIKIFKNLRHEDINCLSSPYNILGTKLEMVNVKGAACGRRKESQLKSGCDGIWLQRTSIHFWSYIASPNGLEGLREPSFSVSFITHQRPRVSAQYILLAWKYNILCSSFSF